jgi:hypothetical protein
MAEKEKTGELQRLVIRLAGLKPGTSPDEMAAAVQRLMPRLPEAKIRQALDRLPLTLSKSATKEQALKVKRFLEPKGALLKIGYASPAERSPASPLTQPAAPPTPAPSAPEALAPSEKAAPSGAERRVKPRIHPGIQVRPMGIGEILDRSFRLLRQYFWLIFLIPLIPQGVYFVVGKLMMLLFTGSLAQEPTVEMGIGLGIAALIAFPVFLIIQFWAQGALIHAVSETYLGHHTSVRIAYGAIRGRLWRLLGTLLLMGFLIALLPALLGILGAVAGPLFSSMGINPAFLGILVFIAMIVAVLVAINLFFNWLMVDKVVVLEDIAWRRALNRSKELMKARTEPGFWKGTKMKASIILLVGLLIVGAIHLVVQVPGLAFTLLMPGNLIGITIQEILNMGATSFATAYTATAMILFYYDIRVRKEGFDLKMMAENL